MVITFDWLKRSAATLRPSPITKTGTFNLHKTMVMPLANVMAVQYRFNPASKNVKDPYYDTIIAFHDLDFYEEPDANHPFKVEITQKSGLLGWRRTKLVRYMTKPSLSKTNCKVTCTCPDFYWTWYWYVLRNAHALAGYEFTGPKGVRVTDGKAYGSPGTAKRNQLDRAGICKHINAVAESLKVSNTVKS